LIRTCTQDFSTLRRNYSKKRNIRRRAAGRDNGRRGISQDVLHDVCRS